MKHNEKDIMQNKQYLYLDFKIFSKLFSLFFFHFSMLCFYKETWQVCSKESKISMSENKCLKGFSML